MHDVNSRGGCREFHLGTTFLLVTDLKQALPSLLTFKVNV